MKLKILQKQDKELLEEHAKSSFNFGGLGKNELYIAVLFLLIGIIISWFLESNRLTGLPFIAIGLLEIIKYPTREKRWVKRKQKQKIFNKNIAFEIVEDTLKIGVDEEVKTHHFNTIKQCLISDTGILFKISWMEYYYISFKSLKKEQFKWINHLKENFKEGKLKVK